MRRYTLILFIIITTFSFSCRATNVPTELKNYIQKLIDQGYSILNDETLSEQEKVRRSSILVAANIDTDWMANYVLGRNKKLLPKQKIHDFSVVYKQFIVKVYAELTKNYQGEKVSIKQIIPMGNNSFIVKTEVIQSKSNDPVNVDYLILVKNNTQNESYLIGDIITEGVSIINSQQSEFNSIINSQGIDILINDLKNKLNK